MSWVSRKKDTARVEDKKVKGVLEECRRRGAETEALLSASRAVLKFEDFAGAARAIFDACKNLIGATGGYIALLSSDGTGNEVVFLDSGGLPCSVDESLPMPIRGLRGKVSRTGKAAYDNSFMESKWVEFMPAGHVRLDNVLFAPLLIESKTVGLLGIANKPGGFVDNDLRLATAFCDLVAAALYNDRTFEMLEKSEERFRSVTQSATDAIISANSNGNILSWNNGAQAMFGYKEDEIFGRPLTELMAPEYRDAHTDGIRRFLDSGEAKLLGQTKTMHGVRKNGSTFPLELSLSTWKTREGIFFGSVIRDITRRRQTEELSAALNEINAAMSSTLDLDEIMERVVNNSARSLGCDSVAIFLHEDNGWVLGSQYGLPEADMAGARFSDAEAPVMVIAAREKQPVFVGDVATDSRMSKRSGAKKTADRSFLAVPLIARKEVMGVITFNHHSAPSTFSDGQVDFASKLAASMSLAIENARLYQKEQENRAKIQSHANQLSVLYKIGLAINRETDKRRLLSMVLKNAAELTRAGTGAMMLVREGKTDLVSMYYAPWYDGRCEIVEDATILHRRINMLVGSERDVARINDLAKLPRTLNLPEGHLNLRELLIGTLRDTRGAIMGHFMLSDKAGGEKFTSQDEEIISLLAAQSSVALVSAENFEREHYVAETLQSALLPQAPIRDDMEVGLLYRSSGRYGKVGGDFYDFIELGDGRIAIAVGDVCGKGLKAATYTAMIKYMLRAYLEEGLFPGDCLTRLNRAVHKQVSIEKFVTMGLALVDTGRKIITYSSAGHPPTLVSRNGRVNPLHARTAVPLGVLPDYTYLSSQEPLGGDISILMYTDGLIEARPEGGESFGPERLAAELLEQSFLPAQGLADALIAAAMEYSGGSLKDDIALLVVKLTGGETAA